MLIRACHNPDRVVRDPETVVNSGLVSLEDRIRHFTCVSDSIRSDQYQSHVCIFAAERIYWGPDVGLVFVAANS